MRYIKHAFQLIPRPTTINNFSQNLLTEQTCIDSSVLLPLLAPAPSSRKARQAMTNKRLSATRYTDCNSQLFYKTLHIRLEELFISAKGRPPVALRS